MLSSHIPVLAPVGCDFQLQTQNIRVVGLFSTTVGGMESHLNLALTDKYLLHFEDPANMVPTHVATLNFDLKFEIIRETPWKDELTPGRPVGIRFEKELPNKSFDVLEIYSFEVALLNAWKDVLQSKLNQRSFHTLFKAKKKIGKGAFATVYLAQRLQDKKLVAVKAFSKQRQYSGQQGKQSLVNQINLMRKFDHPNIIRLYGVYETNCSIYVILQILQGKQLYDRLKNNEIKNPKDVCEIIKNILSALKSLSEKRVIHRDLKPQNIMFRKQGSNDLAICDFGLATYADEEKYLFVRCGTPGFVAPEIINIRDMATKSDPISDVFSAGLILHYLLFGRSIFDGKKYQQILTENRACSFDFEKQIYRTSDFVTMDLLKKLLEVNKNNRISAADALRHPFFEVGRFDSKMSFANMTNNEEMIDEKDQEKTAVGCQGKILPTKNIQSLNGSAKKKNSFRGSIYCDKQNQTYQISMSKKTSFVSEIQGQIRRSKRSSIHEKKSQYQQGRF